MKISSLPFYRQLSPSGRNLLTQNLTALSVEGGQILHEAGDGSYGMIFVEEGSVSVSLSEGITLLRLRKGDVCFLTATDTLPDLTFGVSLVAETDARILSLSDEPLESLMKRDPDFAKYVYRSVARDFSAVVRLLNSVLFSTVEYRIAVLLLDELEISESATLTLTHGRIAKHIGSAREVVTRTLRRMAEEGILSLGRGSVTVLDTSALKKKIHTASSQKST